MDRILSYYDENAEKFINGTVDVDFNDVANRFASYLNEGDLVLDYGYDAGRDIKYFRGKGFRVEAMDGSKKLCRYISNFTGIEVNACFFRS